MKSVHHCAINTECHITRGAKHKVMMQHLWRTTDSNFSCLVWMKSVHHSSFQQLHSQERFASASLLSRHHFHKTTSALSSQHVQWPCFLQRKSPCPVIAPLHQGWLRPRVPKRITNLTKKDDFTSNNNTFVFCLPQLQLHLMILMQHLQYNDIPDCLSWGPEMCKGAHFLQIINPFIYHNSKKTNEIHMEIITS